jgi:hypothetical protein
MTYSVRDRAAVAPFGNNTARGKIQKNGNAIMKCSQNFLPSRVMAITLLCLSSLIATTCVAQVTAAKSKPPIGPGNTIVKSQFGGQIFGFDIDQNGTEGLLTEAQDLGGGLVLAAAETFDQATGKILKVVKKIESKSDFLTLGVVGKSIGLVELEHVTDLYVDKRVYGELNPLSSNQFTALWKAPLTAKDIITGVSRNQASPIAAVLAFDNEGNFPTFVFGSNIGANKFGQKIPLTDPVFFFSNIPSVAYDSQTGEAVIAASDGTVGGPAPVIALANLSTGKVTEFNGLLGPPPFHQGSINGLAVDSADGIACTTTELDFSVEFYDLKTTQGFAVTLPGASGQLQSGSDVEFDPVNKLFFVAQSFSSTGAGSSIQVFDTKGNFVESLNGFNFSNGSNVISTHIALNPSNRTGYVDGPDSGVTELQSFSY